jgi:holo-ACP synthase
VLKPSPVLEAREQRGLKKRELGRALEKKVRGSPFALAVCTLRMPAPLRLSGAYDDIPVYFLKELRAALAAASNRVLDEGVDRYPDGPSAWLAAACSPETLKHLAIEFEERHPRGALVDIDISDATGEALSRRSLGFPARACLICGEDAAVCAAGQRHSPEQIAARVRAIAGK